MLVIKFKGGVYRMKIKKETLEDIKLIAEGLGFVAILAEIYVILWLIGGC